jgi:hypothetical protein
LKTTFEADKDDMELRAQPGTAMGSTYMTSVGLLLECQPGVLWFFLLLLLFLLLFIYFLSTGV